MKPTFNQLLSIRCKLRVQQPLNGDEQQAWSEWEAYKAQQPAKTDEQFANELADYGEYVRNLPRAWARFKERQLGVKPTMPAPDPLKDALAKIPALIKRFYWLTSLVLLLQRLIHKLRLANYKRNS